MNSKVSDWQIMKHNSFHKSESHYCVQNDEIYQWDTWCNADKANDNFKEFDFCNNSAEVSERASCTYQRHH